MSVPGYSTELYDTIAAFGLHRGAAILDVGCGDGTASAPFIANAFPVTGIDPSPQALALAREMHPAATFQEGAAEALPFPQERFDVAISAQAVHLFDRAKALQEMHRVLRASGIVAVWWKQLMTQEGIREIRDRVFREFNREAPAEGLTGGFTEFYASEQFEDQTLRVLPWRKSVSLAAFIDAERANAQTQQALGSRLQQFLESLERHMSDRLGRNNPTVTLAYIQYLYLAKKR